MVKRHGNLWEQVISKENFLLAYQKSKKGKGNFVAVQRFQHNWEEKLEAVRQLLITKTFHTAPYNRKTVYEPKERIIYVLPYKPDRIVQHALMNILTPILRGYLSQTVMRALSTEGNTKAV